MDTNVVNSMQLSEDERENLKNRIHDLESELNDLKQKQFMNITSAEYDEYRSVKNHSEEMLMKAKGLIFDQSKICRNQELQIQALNQQISSLKEVLALTKSLLGIRNMEVTQLQEKINQMETKINTEKDRSTLINKKMIEMENLNLQLRKEYEVQLDLFKQLKKTYEKRDEIQKKQ